MNTRRLACACAVAMLGAAPAAAAVSTDVSTVDDPTLLRVFLKDGTSLVSYGEPARLDDRVVFSMPTSASTLDPRLHLVNISSDKVDWDRTARYTDAARAARYIATMAETHYAQLTYEIAQALNDVALTDDPAKRLAIVERARRTLAAWPARHFDYRKTDVEGMLAILDEAIADLRAAAGSSNFDLSFVAAVDTPPLHEPLLPPPTPKEAIEQTLRAAGLADQSDERTSLLAMALTGIDRDAGVLPSAWLDNTRLLVRARLDAELEIDSRYRELSSRVMSLAVQRARAADVRGVERLATDVRARDVALGAARPSAVGALLAAVQDQLDAARRLRLARDRWALRVGAFRAYQASIAAPLGRLGLIKGPLEDVRALAGSLPAALAALERTAGDVLKAIAAVAPPEELQTAHAVLVSAAQMADSAARIRREAAISGDLPRAWDASSAAAGALMLTARARTEIEAVLSLPQLPR